MQYLLLPFLLIFFFVGCQLPNRASIPSSAVAVADVAVTFAAATKTGSTVNQFSGKIATTDDRQRQQPQLQPQQLQTNSNNHKSGSENKTCHKIKANTTKKKKQNKNAENKMHLNCSSA